MAFAGMTVAQDVYTAGYYTKSNGLHVAAVYKNGTKLHEMNGSYNYESTGVVVYNGDVYWVKNAMSASNTSEYLFGDVMKNNSIYLKINY